MGFLELDIPLFDPALCLRYFREWQLVYVHVNWQWAVTFETWNIGGCLGCCSKPPLVISVDEPSKGLKIQGQCVKKRSLTEDLWSTSSGHMDNSGFPSHRSMSSISTTNQTTFDTQSSSGGSSNPAEFVNHGLLLWNQTRQQWVGNKRSEKLVQSEEPKLSWNTTYESLLGTNKLFPQPIPLAEMVDFLVDVWEQEGLYD